MGLESGTTNWKRYLPAGAEVRDNPQAHPGGVTLELVSRNTKPSLMTLDRKGNLQGIGKPEDGILLSLPNGSLLSGPQGLEMIQSVLPPKAAPLPTRVVQQASKKDLTQLWDSLPWQGEKQAQYAIIQHQNKLLIAFEMGDEGTFLKARVGNSGPKIDSQGQILNVQRNRKPTLSSHPEGWQMDEYLRLSNGPDGAWRGVIRLSPPVLMDPLRQPELYISSNLENPSAAAER